MRVKIRYPASDPLVGPARISLEAVLPSGDISAARTGPRVSFTLTAQLGLAAPVWAATVIPKVPDKTRNNPATKHLVRAFIFFSSCLLLPALLFPARGFRAS